MSEKIIEIFLRPLYELESQYAVWIDGVEYLPMEDFAELFARCFSCASDISLKLIVFAFFFVIAIFAMIAVSVFVVNVLCWRKKNVTVPVDLGVSDV